MAKLILTRGLPASGKTTRARQWVAENPAGRARVNKDDLRRMCHNGVFLGNDTERQINVARDATIGRLLKLGVDVVSDDTNLPQRVARDVARIGRLNGAEVEVWDLTDLPLDECLRRDNIDMVMGEVGHRPGIGEEPIRKMYLKYIAGKRYPLPSPDDPAGPGEVPGNVVPYVGKPGTMRAVMVDLDGTVALFNGRDPFDETRVHTDLPNLPVIRAVEAMHAQGYTVLFCSGRTDGCRDATRTWLVEHFGEGFMDRSQLFMRAAGDYRKDAIVKLELFDRHIRDHYTVLCVFDDRDQVVEAWRSIGLTVMQVAKGDF